MNLLSRTPLTFTDTQDPVRRVLPCSAPPLTFAAELVDMEEARRPPIYHPAIIAHRFWHDIRQPAFCLPSAQFPHERCSCIAIHLRRTLPARSEWRSRRTHCPALRSAACAVLVAVLVCSDGYACGGMLDAKTAVS